MDKRIYKIFRNWTARLGTSVRHSGAVLSGAYEEVKSFVVFTHLEADRGRHPNEMKTQKISRRVAERMAPSNRSPQARCTVTIFLLSCFALLAACSNRAGGQGPVDFNVSTDTPFTIRSESDLIGGPNAQGRVGDILLRNDRIRLVIQKPRKNAGLNSFGGNIIDADIVRGAGEQGQDNFGSVFPLVNVEWTVNYRNIEVISDGADGGPKVVRAVGVIDVYDYIDVDFITEVAQSIIGQSISFPNRFDDRRNPFTIYPDLQGLSTEVVTDYILYPGASFVRIDTTFTNPGDKSVRFPMGQFLNGSGELSMLIPGMGFTPDLMTQVGGNTPAVIFAAFDTSDISYGFFYKASQFLDSKKNEPLTSTSISYSGFTGLIFGDELLKMLLSQGEPEINFSVPAQGQRTVTNYLVVGSGSAGSVFDAGLAVIGAAAKPINGKIIDQDGNAVVGATVAALFKGQTLITYRTDSNGRFFGMLPTGENLESKRFGNGSYSFSVDVPGYHKNNTATAGECKPGEIDIAKEEPKSITCVLGESALVELKNPVIDFQTKAPIVARLTIVGEDPSPNRSGAAGRFRSTIEWDPPFGIYDLKYITAKGTFDLTDSSKFKLEPGTYRFVISHGLEYTIDERVVEASAGKSIIIENVKLKKVVKTNGYVSSDFHVHSISSPDSSLAHNLRVLSASGEGLDILQSSDHDFVTDYRPYINDMASQSAIPVGSLKAAAGDEVTPNHYGHLHFFPLEPNAKDPEGGAIDWSGSAREDISPAPDYNWTLDELISLIRSAPGERIVMIDHVMDNPSGIPAAAGWVTTPFYRDVFGVEPLSSYADPVERRMPPAANSASFPLPIGTTGLMTLDFDAIELAIGQKLYDNSTLFNSALPTWFNLLNLGVIATATADSDSHRTVMEPIGLPRNFIESSVDPADDIGSDHSEISLKEYTANIKAHRLTISAGAFVEMFAKSESGEIASIGDTVAGYKVKITVNVQAASWAWFDTINIYANTEPIPVDDKTDMPMSGTAADPAVFYKPYHIPRYTYEPMKSFKLSDGSLASWKEEEGLITATVEFDLTVNEDTWIVALAHGTRSTKGYRSLFPVSTNVLVDSKNVPEDFDPANLTPFHADKRVGAPAWGLTNPIFVDIEGDGFKSKYRMSQIK